MKKSICMNTMFILLILSAIPTTAKTQFGLNKPDTTYYWFSTEQRQHVAEINMMNDMPFARHYVNGEEYTCGCGKDKPNFADAILVAVLIDVPAWDTVVFRHEVAEPLDFVGDNFSFYPHLPLPSLRSWSTPLPPVDILENQESKLSSDAELRSSRFESCLISSQKCFGSREGEILMVDPSGDTLSYKWGDSTATLVGVSWEKNVPGIGIIFSERIVSPEDYLSLDSYENVSLNNVSEGTEEGIYQMLSELREAAGCSVVAEKKADVNRKIEKKREKQKF